MIFDSRVWQKCLFCFPLSRISTAYARRSVSRRRGGAGRDAWSFNSNVRRFLAGVIASSAFAGIAAVSQEAPLTTIKSESQLLVLALVARDKKGQPVRDLKAEDIVVLDQQLPQSLKSFTLVERGSSHDTNMVPLLGANSSCNTGWKPNSYYELTYYPSASVRTGGYHRVVITSKRKSLRLNYRRGYFAARPSGAREETAGGERQPDSDLTQAACNSVLPSQSVLLHPSLVRPQTSKENAQFALAIEPQLLTITTTKKQEAQTNFVLAACAFDRDGTPVKYHEEKVQRRLAGEQAAAAKHGGIEPIFTFPLLPRVISLRFVVRDVETGRVGSIDFPYQPTFATAEEKDVRLPLHEDWHYFGSPVRSDDSFCGEAWDLTNGEAPDLYGFPRGVLHTPFLDVPNQTDRYYLPGIGRTGLFRINYYGKFWVDTPGRYWFKLQSDDGARLYVDDVQLADTYGIHIAAAAEADVVLERGEHFIHVPYYEGNPTEVALQLWIKPPHGKERIFDLRNYSTSGRFRWAVVQPDVKEEIAPSQIEGYCRKVAAGVSAPEALSNACQFVFSQIPKLPNVICGQRTERYRARLNGTVLEDKILQDVVTSEVGFLRGKETYSDLVVGSTPSASPSRTGAWAEGEFGPLLEMIFSPQTATRWGSTAQTVSLAGVPALAFDFQIEKRNNHSWYLHFPPPPAPAGASEIVVLPGAKGRIWLSESGHQVLRLELEALPSPDLPARRVAVSVNYAQIKLGDGSVELLPTGSESEFCTADKGQCSRNVITFQECRKFAARSRLVLGP